MEHWNRIKIAKRQILITNFFVLLLGLSTATMAAVTHFGDHFTVIGHVSLERNPYGAMHYWAFYVGISLAGLLSLGAALSTIATVREAHGLMAAGFLCFALSFCVLVQMAFWRFHNPTQVEDAVLDTYDLVYDQAMKSPSSSWWQELATIQDTFLCCGKKSPFGLLASTRAIPCQGQEAMREDCLQSIGKFLWTHYRIASTLTFTSLALTVYAMTLCAFLWFAIHSYCGLDRKGRYTLSPRSWLPVLLAVSVDLVSLRPSLEWLSYHMVHPCCKVREKSYYAYRGLLITYWGMVTEHSGEQYLKCLLL